MGKKQRINWLTTATDEEVDAAYNDKSLSSKERREVDAERKFRKRKNKQKRQNRE